MLKKVFIIILICSTFLFSNENKEKIKVCYLEWGKLGGQQLPSYGLVPDIVSTTLKEAGYEPEIKILPWSRCLKLVELNRYDMVAGFWIGEEQKKTYQYFEANTLDHISFITMNDFKANSGKLEDFYGKSVSYIRDAGGLENFFSKKDKYELFPVTNDIQMIRLLKSGRIDAIVSDPVQILSLVENNFPELVDKLKIWKPHIKTNIGAPAISHTNPKKQELIKKYNEAFIKLVKNGMYDDMMKKHGVVLDYKKYN